MILNRDSTLKFVRRVEGGKWKVEIWNSRFKIQNLLLLTGDWKMEIGNSRFMIQGL